MNSEDPAFRQSDRRLHEKRDRTSDRPDLLAYLLLGATVLILGFNWPLLAIGLRDLSPLWFGTLRLTSATIVVFAVTATTGRLRRPAAADLPVIGSIGLGRLVGVLLLVLLALQIVPPGRSSVLVWTASLWTVPIAARYLGETMTRRRWRGLTVGIAGILILVEPWRTDVTGEAIWGYALLLVAAVIHAATAVHARGHRWSGTALSLLPWQLLLATIPVAAVAVSLEGVPRVHWTPTLAAIVAYQGVLATSVAMWAQLTVLQRLPAVPTNLALMLVPAVGFISSVLVVGERLTVAALIGAITIGAGVVTGMDLRRGPVAPHVD